MNGKARKPVNNGKVAEENYSEFQYGHKGWIFGNQTHLGIF